MVLLISIGVATWGIVDMTSTTTVSEDAPTTIDQNSNPENVVNGNASEGGNSVTAQ